MDPQSVAKESGKSSATLQALEHKVLEHKVLERMEQEHTI